jgi:hypothetical protein
MNEKQRRRDARIAAQCEELRRSLPEPVTKKGGVTKAPEVPRPEAASTTIRRKK